MSERLRVAVVSHGHPELHAGGAEQASHALFQHLKDRPEIEPTYVARADPAAIGHAAPFASFRGRRGEILWSPPGFDGFRLVSGAPVSLGAQAAEVFLHADCDVVHLHHYWGFGADIVRIIRDQLDIPVVVTLHEYLAICNNFGQMVKTDGGLCYAESPAECSACFPDVSSGKFFLRKELILENLAYADLFIAPSAFLAERYIAWGLDRRRIRVIDNPLSARAESAAPGPDVAARDEDEPIRLGYFGQLTPYKGVETLLDAVALLKPRIRKRMALTLFGFDPSRADPELSKKLSALKRRVFVHGTYPNADVGDLMRSVDWAVVPSIWWENAPMVIQEAKAAGVPVLCSDIGGMQEKVRPGLDGAHFAARSSLDLAAKIRAIVEGRLAVDVEPSNEHADLVDKIIHCYRAVSAEAARRSQDDGRSGLVLAGE